MIDDPSNHPQASSTRCPYLSDPKAIAAMTLAVSNVAQTRSVLNALDDRPDHETVDTAKAKLTHIESTLSEKLEDLVLAYIVNSDSHNKTNKKKKNKKSKTDAAAVIPTVTVTIAGSIIHNAQSLELATRLAVKLLVPSRFSELMRWWYLTITVSLALRKLIIPMRIKARLGESGRSDNNGSFGFFWRRGCGW